MEKLPFTALRRIEKNDLISEKPDRSKFTKETNIQTTPLTPREAFEKKENIVGLAGISLGINRWLFLGIHKKG